MSKIALTPNASGTGTFTLAAPNSNTSRTITLPDEAGEVLVNTATGVDITGTLTSDGLTVESSDPVVLQHSATGPTLRFNNIDQTVADGQQLARLEFSTDDAGIEKDEAYIQLTADGNAGAAFLDIMTGDSAPTKTARFSTNGDISFYEDTGTTPKFFWDASAESLGIGTTSPNRAFHVLSSAAEQATFASSGAIAGINFQPSGATVDHNRILVTGGEMLFVNSNAERMRIDSSGNVGIGTTSPSQKLDVRSGSFNSDVVQITGANDGRGLLISTTNRASNDDSVVYNAQFTGGQHIWEIAGTERMRIDGSGNLLVGTTDSTPYNNSAGSTADNGIALGATGIISSAKYNDATINLNRTGTDGDIAKFRKNGSIVGSIGVTASGNNIYYQGSSVKTGVEYGSSAWIPFYSNARADNYVDLGVISSRFQDIYATNSTINTSDRNEKQDIEVLSDAETRVAQACKGLLRKFRWQDAVAEKGDDARIHFGIIAQDLQDAFAAEGLDAGRYAMFISSTWTDEETGEERTRLGVRYPELLAFIIGAM